MLFLHKYIPSLYTCRVSIYLMSLEMSLKAYKKWNIYSRKSTKAWQRQGKPVTLHPWPISSSPPSPTWWHLHSTWVQARSHSGHPPHPAADQSDSSSSWEELSSVVFIPPRHPSPPAAEATFQVSEVCDMEAVHAKNTRTSISLARLPCEVCVACWKKSVKQIEGTLVTATSWNRTVIPRDDTAAPAPAPGRWVAQRFCPGREGGQNNCSKPLPKRADFICDRVWGSSKQLAWGQEPLKGDCSVCRCRLNHRLLIYWRKRDS